MSELRYRFLTDENIAPDVVGGLRQRGYDVRSAAGESLFGRDDATVLRHAHEDNRVVVTHDLAFGRSALADGAAFTGIIYLRPGHISAAFVLEAFDAIDLLGQDLVVPFVLVAERRQQTVKVRLRTAPPW